MLIKCPVCGFETENLCWPHIKKHGFSSSKEFKLKFNLKYLKSERIRVNQSKFIKNNNPMAGKEHSEESIQKMKINRKNKGVGKAGKYKRTKEIKEKLSKTIVNLHLKGIYDKIKPGIGEFIFCRKANKTIFVRSSWEKRLALAFEKHPDIESFDYEQFTIPYEWEGAIHNFIPDFYISICDGAIKEIWEVKRDDFIESDPKTHKKFEALNKFCSKNRFNYRIIGLKDLIRFEKAAENAALKVNQI